MNRVIMILTGLMLLAGVAYADHYNVENKIGDMIAKVNIENHTMKVSDNKISIELLDLEGNAITNAEMAVYYFMPSMPAMNYEVKALLKGKQYEAVIKPTMPGEWTADIRVKIGEEKSHTTAFNFNAE